MRSPSKTPIQSAGRIEPLSAGIRDGIGSLEHHLAGVVELARVQHRDHGADIGLAQRAS